MSDHLRYPPDELEAPVRVPLYPVDRVYPLGPVEAVPGPFPDEETWARAFRAETFFRGGRPEAADRRTAFRLVRGEGRLFVAVECPEGVPGGAADAPPDSAAPPGAAGSGVVEVLLTRSGKAEFPVMVFSVSFDERLACGVLPRPYTPWLRAPLEPVDGEGVRCRVSVLSGRRRVELALPVSALGVSAAGFRFNVVRRAAGGGAWAWCDLFDGPAGQVEIFARAVQVQDPEHWAHRLAMPAEVAVGMNRLRLERPAPGLALRAAGRTAPFDAEGCAELPVTAEGPLEVELVHPTAGVIARHRADVARPVVVAAHEPFLPAEAKECRLDLTLNLAGGTPLPVALALEREEGGSLERTRRLKPGRHTLEVPLPPGGGREVTVTARVSVPAADGEATLSAEHWFAVGVRRGDLDRFRDFGGEAATEDLLWRMLAEAAPFVRLMQAGSGAYGLAEHSQRGMWRQAVVYLFALLYKRSHPENPHAGDRRLLRSAALGMDFALRPTISAAEHQEPDNRSLQAFLLTYELLKDDVDPARSGRWARELLRRAEGAVLRWLTPLDSTLGLTSADCGTGTNHMVYHIANVYLAGDVFGRADWRDLAGRLMRRLADYGREGHFEERKGVPVNHYTWLSANGLGQYHRRSGDPAVEPTLEACARYLAAVSTAECGLMALHDGRNADHGGGSAGFFVLTRTPRGRDLVRKKVLQVLRGRPSAVGLEALWRWAETAAYLQTGPEEDFTGDDELVFSHGAIVRRAGFHYGLSTISVGPINRRFRLDPQNVVEVFHRRAGAILHGGNSALQPEAGTFFRPLPSENPAVGGLPAPTAPRVDYLPITASVHRLADGHDLELAYWSFTARLALHVLSGERARLVVTVHFAEPGEPVVFNFFPGVAEPGELEASPRALRFGDVRIEASREVAVERDFRTLNPYRLAFAYACKPVRCWVTLGDGETFTLDLRVE